MFHTVSSIGVRTPSKINLPCVWIMPSATVLQIKTVAILLLKKSRKNLNSPGIRTPPFELAVYIWLPWFGGSE